MKIILEVQLQFLNCLPAVTPLSSLNTSLCSQMDKQVPPSLFVNHGSFLEKFKQLQQEKGGDSKPKTIAPGTLTPNSMVNKFSGEQKNSQPASGGKLAFSFKQKPKLVAPAVKLGADKDEDEEQTD